MRNFDFETEYEKTLCEGKFVEERVQLAENKKAYFFAKRAFDIFFSLLALMLLFIPSVFVVLLIKITTHGPVFYLQDRLGKNGKEFKIIKFRTMQANAEENCGPKWSDDNDPRVTKIGKFLRKSHLDEVPQFINVLKGDMSIVGPRPERRYFYNEFAKYIDGFEQRMLVPQGITGFAQTIGKYDKKPEQKIIYDLQYIKNPSLILDLWLIIKTVF